MTLLNPGLRMSIVMRGACYLPHSDRATQEEADSDFVAQPATTLRTALFRQPWIKSSTLAQSYAQQAAQ